MSKAKIYISQSSLTQEEEEELTTGQYILSKVISAATSPTTVWFASLYFTVLISMICFNVNRQGFNRSGFLGGPRYYATLFLTYGLNDESTYVNPWMHGVGAWLFAPFIAVWLGVVLYFTKMAGFAFNGKTFSDPTGAFFYAFFADNVYGFEHNFFGAKGNMFYLGIVWIPIFVSCIITIYYKNWVRRETSIVTRFFINVLISFWVGFQMARMTDPHFWFDWGNMNKPAGFSYLIIVMVLVFALFAYGAYQMKWVNSHTENKLIWFTFILLAAIGVGYKLAIYLTETPPRITLTSWYHGVAIGHLVMYAIIGLMVLLYVNGKTKVTDTIDNFAISTAAFAIATFILALIISFFLRLILPLPIKLDTGGWGQSMSQDRKFNVFVQYSGDGYHPTNLATAIFLYHIIILIFYSLLDNLGSFLNYIRSQVSVVQKRREMFLERRSQGIMNLPWEIDDETQKVQKSMEAES